MLARRKAQSVFEALENKDGAYVIGSDTVVCIDGKILGKPTDEADARRMLLELSGRKHTVYTGISVVTKEKAVADFDATDVYFRKMSEADIEKYIASKEPMDKAGAYGAQGIGAAFVERIDGDFFSVMGLPLCRLCKLFLTEFGVNLLDGE